MHQEALMAALGDAGSEDLQTVTHMTQSTYMQQGYCMGSAVMCTSLCRVSEQQWLWRTRRGWWGIWGVLQVRAGRTLVQGLPDWWRRWGQKVLRQGTVEGICVGPGLAQPFTGDALTEACKSRRLTS